MNKNFAPGIAIDGGAETELHAIAWAGNLRRARRLVRRGADVNHIDSAGETPLHGAAAWGRASMVRFLLSVGARHDIAALNTNNMTPLLWAARANLKTVKVLLKAGADRDAKDAQGNTAYDIAKKYLKPEIMVFLASN
ncbi:ankyrin repeat domain-containing protein [Pseudomonas sp. LPB0260]|uniref:ankyrin repeat domain-containing protein n=1 Tax=Pseudomonas sp. LPB0260 TaxID=2614442 RepID=UPI0015C1DD49|nr:ankyrin repeat domain-containing protein [Pseudomonas sp. LPB0260]QLC74114.1 ankyrin repeat domain-containing protein [Pseudomonas sp. LPB0260]QLC76885.1 ankyrin repeat domain-containing protein [Pseudomonas sp. LPB0260]